MRTAAYCRYSSDDQRAASIRDQARNCSTYAERMGWMMPKVYADEAISGARSDRPEYQRMLEDARQGAFGALLVDDLSRLSRDHIESARALRLLGYLGIRVIGVSDGIDTQRKGHKLEAGVRGLMSELYLDDLAEKTHRGLTGQALAGYSAGGLPYGYRSVHDGQGYRREIVPDQADTLRRIFALYAAGHSPRAIAAALNEDHIPAPRGRHWMPSAIYGHATKGTGILNQALYTGRQIWNRSQWVHDPLTGRRKRRERPESEWIITDHPELRIIDEHTWQAVKQRQRATRERTGTLQASARRAAAGGRGPKYLFSGLLVCGTCGARFVVVDRYRYGCAAHKDRGADTCANGIKVPRATVERALLAGIKAELLSTNAVKAFERELRRAVEAHKPDPTAARRALASATQERDNILAAIRAGIITPTTKQAMESAEREVASAQDRLDAIDTHAPAQIIPRAREIYRRLVDQLENIQDIPAARTALTEIVGEEIRLMPDSEGILTAEIQGGLAALESQIIMVAGARLKRYLTPVMIRLV